MMKVSTKRGLLTNCVREVRLANEKFADLRKNCEHVVDTLIDGNGDVIYVCKKAGMICTPDCCVSVKK